MTKPITIVGGGLSGLALGCFLRNHQVPVCIIERGSYPRHKVCGEFICGVELQTLENLGILPAFDQRNTVSNIQWSIGENQIIDRPLPKDAIGISRHLLDDELQRLFRSLGGTFDKQNYDLQNIPLEKQEGLILACGKEQRGKGSDKRRWLGLKMHVSKLDLEGLEMHTGHRSQKGGYVGLSPIENGKVNVCGLFEVNKKVAAKGAETLLAYLESVGLADLAQRLRIAEIDEASFSAVAGFSLGTQTSFQDPDQNTMLIGDAAILIPPFTGNGMSIALESAYLAGQALLPYCKSELSWSESLKNYRSAMNQKFKSRLLISKFLHPMFFSSLGRSSLSILSKTKLLPFNLLFKLLR